MKIGNELFGIALFLLTSSLSCKKHSAAPQPAPGSGVRSYALKMGGLRAWHGTQNHQCWLCLTSIDTTYSTADTFAINVVDTAKIVIPFTPFTSYDTMYYASANDSSKTLTFSTGAVNPFYNGYIVYYYLNDSIVYHTMLRITECFDKVILHHHLSI